MYSRSYDNGIKWRHYLRFLSSLLRTPVCVHPIQFFNFFFLLRIVCLLLSLPFPSLLSTLPFVAAPYPPPLLSVVHLYLPSLFLSPIHPSLHPFPSMDHAKSHAHIMSSPRHSHIPTKIPPYAHSHIHRRHTQPQSGTIMHNRAPSPRKKKLFIYHIYHHSQRLDI